MLILFGKSLLLLAKKKSQHPFEPLGIVMKGTIFDLLKLFSVPVTSHSNCCFLICSRSCKAFSHWPSPVWERRQWYAGPLPADRPRRDGLLPRGVRGETSSPGLDLCGGSQGRHHDQKREAGVSSPLLALLCLQEGQVSAVEEIYPESEGRYGPFLTFFWELEHLLI